jgi:hypothetical protein
VTVGVRRRLRLLPDGFDTVDKLYTQDEFGQLVMPVEAAPALLGQYVPGQTLSPLGKHLHFV